MEDNQEIKYRSRISVVTSLGAFAVAGLSIYCGYDLFRLGVNNQVAISAQTASENIELYAAAPGSVFLLFGIYLASKALNKLINAKSIFEQIAGIFKCCKK